MENDELIEEVGKLKKKSHFVGIVVFRKDSQTNLFNSIEVLIYQQP